MDNFPDVIDLNHISPESRVEILIDEVEKTANIRVTIAERKGLSKAISRRQKIVREIAELTEAHLKDFSLSIDYFDEVHDLEISLHRLVASIGPDPISVDFQLSSSLEAVASVILPPGADTRSTSDMLTAVLTELVISRELKNFRIQVASPPSGGKPTPLEILGIVKRFAPADAETLQRSLLLKYPDLTVHDAKLELDRLRKRGFLVHVKDGRHVLTPTGLRALPTRRAARLTDVDRALRNRL